MSHLPELAVVLPTFTSRQLVLQDAPTLQKLYEACHDYALLEQGSPYTPTAARDEFGALPPGKPLDDKFLFGLFTECGDIIALIESIRHYPDERTWWLGLLLVAPAKRRNHIGAHFYAAFEHWVKSQGAHSIQLAALEENEAAQRFWQSLGFTETRRTEPKPYGSKCHILIVMQKPLGEYARLNGVPNSTDGS